jgi:alkylation response protein AidB-like acyl-CoA dehydrogenase
MPYQRHDQAVLRQSARAWTQDRCPVGAFRKLRDERGHAGFDPSVWREICDLGWSGILASEHHGGVDLGFVAMGVIAEELGRQLVASPLIASAVSAITALRLAGSTSQIDEFMPALVTGSTIGAFAVDEGSRHAPAATTLRAERDADGWRLSGRKTFVPEGGAADIYLILARTEGEPGDSRGLSMFIIPRDAAGLDVAPLSMVDSRGCAHLTLDNVRASERHLLGPLNSAAVMADGVLDRTRAVLSAEMLGLAGQAFETTVSYLKTRRQFGQPIGAFQALQHRAAEMLTELELARSCVEAALHAIDAADTETSGLVSLAKAKAGDALFLITNEMIQMHGGVGMTDAHDAGLYIKRARVLETMCGDRAFHRDRYARLRGF